MSTVLAPRDVATLQDEHLRDVLDLHLHPKHGSPFWLKSQHALGWDIRDRVRSVGDLRLLGTREPSELRNLSAWEFVPRGLHGKRGEFVVGESGGTSGTPVATVYDGDDFREAFIMPFVEAATHVGFPRGVPWLFLGPSGPHIIGKAARELARSLESPEPWTVDFDPRWAKKLGSPLASRRYLDHVVDQACDVFAREEIGVLFATPPVLRRLSERWSDAHRDRLEAIHYGGLEVTAQGVNEFRQQFPRAVHLSGYGNTLFGCALEVAAGERTAMDYFPRGPRLIFDLDSTGIGSTPTENGRRGPVVFHRLDRSCLLVGIRERDWAELVPPGHAATRLGWTGQGVRNPGPPVVEKPTVKSGIY